MKQVFVLPPPRANIAQAIACNLIQAIPANWHFMWGILDAPQSALANNAEFAATKFVFASSINRIIASNDSKIVPDFFGILFEDKKPGHVEFGYQFTPCELMPLAQSKRIAEWFVMHEYRGRMQFVSRLPDGEDPVPFQCDIWLPEEPGKLGDLVVEFEWDAGRYPQHEEILPLIAACKELHLEERPELAPQR